MLPGGPSSTGVFRGRVAAHKTATGSGGGFVYTSYLSDYGTYLGAVGDPGSIPPSA